MNLTKVLSHENNVIEESVPLGFSVFSSKLGEFEITQKTPVRIKLTHTSKKKVTVEAEASLTILIPCDRCLTDVPTDFHIVLMQELDMNLSEEDRLEELSYADWLEGMELNTDKLVYNEILVEWPTRVLCQEDCKGICSKCGKNLNLSECGCDRTVLDPRMSVISEIFKNAGNP